MGKKWFKNNILVVLVILLIVALIYVTFFKETNTVSKLSPNPNSSQSNQLEKISIPEEYVKVGDSSANQATFTFAVPVNKADIIGKNIEHCVISASAGAIADKRGLECTPTIEENNLALQYDELTRILIISDSVPGEKYGPNFGPFRVGCAACSIGVEFKNIHTSDGQLLPDKMVLVY